jgi:hypothetical protein
MSNTELGEQIVRALEKKLEARYRRRARTAGGPVEPGYLLGELSQLEEQELIAQENKYREMGNEDAAQAFSMVRRQLLRDVVRGLYDRLS